MKIIKLAVLSTLLAASTWAVADVPSKLPPPISLMVQGANLKVQNSFPAAGGLTGWILSSGEASKPILAFTPADGSVVFVGASMIDAKGVNLGEKYLKDFSLPPDYSKIYTNTENSSWIAVGATGSAIKSSIYVYFDPNCGYCHLTWAALQPYIKAGLQVKLVIVGILGQNSVTKASYILGSDNPVAAFNKLNENREWKPSAGDDAIIKKGAAKVDSNTLLMAKSGFRGTPAIVYKSKGVAAVNPGYPDPSDLPSITGLPLQTQTDPTVIGRMKSK